MAWEVQEWTFRLKEWRKKTSDLLKRLESSMNYFLDSKIFWELQEWPFRLKEWPLTFKEWPESLKNDLWDLKNYLRTSRITP